MIKSMTGYGKGQGDGEGAVLTVEIKSVNHRYGDVTVKAPRFLLPLESEIKKKISARLKRGKIGPAVRVALSGGTVSPGIYEVVVTLGKDETLFRLRAALERLV